MSQRCHTCKFTNVFGWISVEKLYLREPGLSQYRFTYNVIISAILTGVLLRQSSVRLVLSALLLVNRKQFNPTFRQFDQQLQNVSKIL